LRDQGTRDRTGQRKRYVAGERRSCVVDGTEPSVVEHRAEVVEVTGDTVTIRDCYIDDAWIETVAAGERANEGAGTQLSTAQMVREGSAWKVSTLTVEESWEGVAGCAAE